MTSIYEQLLAAQTKHRLCSSCNNYKPLSEFTFKNRSRGWLDTRCKTCKTAQQMERLRRKHA